MLVLLVRVLESLGLSAFSRLGAWTELRRSGELGMVRGRAGAGPCFFLGVVVIWGPGGGEDGVSISMANCWLL